MNRTKASNRKFYSDLKPGYIGKITQWKIVSYMAIARWMGGYNRTIST